MREYLISFETAKLAKEKGFDIECDYFYSMESLKILTHKDSLYGKEHSKSNIKEICFYAPTQSLLQKWLREKHFIQVEPTLNFTSDDFPFPFHYNCAVMYNINDEEAFRWLGCDCSYTFYPSYEEALEARLQEALKLIKL